MTNTDHTQWHQVAWNGIRFECPSDWEIGKIGRCYLMLETENGPVLEVKWNTVRGRFSHKTQLRRLSSMHTRRLRRTFRLEPLPKLWQNALGDYDTAGFFWQSNTISGKGALIYCPECKTATLIQFFDSGKKNIEPDAEHLLETFRDHFASGVMPWAVFDISAQVPHWFKLDKYRFNAGEYELAFSTKKQYLTLFRWSPAEVLLREHTLDEIAKVRFDPDGKRHLSMASSGSGIADGSLSPATIWSWAKARIQRRLPYTKIRLWREHEKNRILCVRMDGKQPVEQDAFDRMCSNYESI
jgi:hypothetical protein